MGETLNTRIENLSPLNQEIRIRLERMSNWERQELESKMTDYAFESGLYLQTNDGKRTPIPFFNVPLVLKSSVFDQAAEQVGLVFSSLRKLEDLIYSDDEMLAKILAGVTEPEAKLILAGRKRFPGTANRRNTRFDTFLQPDGTIKVIELNSLCPEGILYYDVLSELGAIFFEKLGFKNLSYSLLRHSQERGTAAQLIDALLQEYFERRPGDPLSSIGIIYDRDSVSEVNNAELPILAERINRLLKEKYALQIAVVVGYVEELEASNGMMFLRGRPVDVLWRNNLEPRLYRGLSSNGSKDVSGLLEVITNPDKYVVFNDEGGRVLGWKGLFALMSNKELRNSLLNHEEILAVERLLPATFFTSGFEGEKTGTVAKPMVGVHGNGVYFGDQTSEEVWNQLLANPNYIIQARVPYPEIALLKVKKDGSLEEVRTFMDFNLHHIGSRALGTAICRASPVDRFQNGIGVLNVAAGGGVVICLPDNL
jgi:hypothetical protein